MRCIVSGIASKLPAISPLNPLELDPAHETVDAHGRFTLDKTKTAEPIQLHVNWRWLGLGG